MSDKPLLAQRLRALRKERGLTQAAVATATGLKTQAITFYENGLRKPNGEAMVSLQSFYNVSGEYLLGETDRRAPTGSWEDNEIMSEVKKGIQPLFNNLLAALEACGDLEQKMTFDILVELRHVLATESLTTEQKQAAMMLLQEAFGISTRFVDACAASSGPAFDSQRIQKARDDTAEQYSQALTQALEAIASK